MASESRIVFLWSLMILHYIPTPIQCSDESIIYRLPTTIQPLHYDLTLQPIFNNFTFIGSQQISINISSDHLLNESIPTRLLTIKLHRGPQMNITKTTLSISDPSNSSNHSLSLSPSVLSYNADTQMVSIPFPISNDTASSITEWITSRSWSHIPAILSMEFVGILRDDMKGFYISKYQVTFQSIYFDLQIDLKSISRNPYFLCFDKMTWC